MASALPSQHHICLEVSLLPPGNKEHRCKLCTLQVDKDHGHLFLGVPLCKCFLEIGYPSPTSSHGIFLGNYYLIWHALLGDKLPLAFIAINYGGTCCMGRSSRHYGCTVMPLCSSHQMLVDLSPCWWLLYDINSKNTWSKIGKEYAVNFLQFLIGQSNASYIVLLVSGELP